jgi:hypothetical protein
VFFCHSICHQVFTIALFEFLRLCQGKGPSSSFHQGSWECLLLNDRSLPRIRYHRNRCRSTVGPDQKKTLGCTEKCAVPKEIKKAYRLVAMQCHPDKGPAFQRFAQHDPNLSVVGENYLWLLVVNHVKQLFCRHCLIGKTPSNH